MATKTTSKTTTKSIKTEDNQKTLVIVESPAKSKTIGKILGKNYIIQASMGHVRDLASKGLGFDIENNFKPTFEVIPEKKKVITELNKLAKTVDRVYLASDPDREGEAIAWHVKECLKFPEDKIFRIVFNEITPHAIKDAVANVHQIDMLKVEAQKTRQILDKLVGFKISPILWEKMKNYKLSAGRVQSVALKIICEREDEIEAFIPVEYWSVDALLNKDKADFQAELARVVDKSGKDVKLELHTKKDVDEVLKILKSAQYKVAKVTPRDTTRKPQPPFITSTLQREASSKLGYGVSKTMQIAQKLYEGIDLGDGSVGLITYMRTDSTRISQDATDAARDFILDNYGEDYYPDKPNVYVKKNQANTQDAHEAIRPSYVDKTPESIKKYLTSEQYRLYKLIWDRFMASQMTNAKVKNITIDIAADKYIFKMGSSKIVFDGFTKIYTEDEEIESAKKFPDLKVGDILNLKELKPEQHFTQPPSRYTEASLVKQLEEYGIGRPSTYAPIITKIQQRNYVEKTETKALKPTPLGRAICKQLSEHFVQIMDYKFTAKMEAGLDNIAEDKQNSIEFLNDFWKPFSKTLEDAKNNMQRVDVETDKVCPNCGRKMVVKISRYGKQFLACSGYPECKTALPMDGDSQVQIPEDEPTDKKCEKCGSEMVIKTGPYGKYYQCLNDKCKKRFSIVESSGVKCPECAKNGRDGELVKRKSRYGTFFWGCSKYPDCSFALWAEPNGGETCPDCGSLLVKKYLKRGNKIACSNKNCKYSRDMEE